MTTTKVGNFEVENGNVIGPKEYMESDSYAKTRHEIEEGTHCLFSHFEVGTPVDMMIAVILQTDYAGWRGTRQLISMLER